MAATNASLQVGKASIENRICLIEQFTLLRFEHGTAASIFELHVQAPIICFHDHLRTCKWSLQVLPPSFFRKASGLSYLTYIWIQNRPHLLIGLSLQSSGCTAEAAETRGLTSQSFPKSFLFLVFPVCSRVQAYMICKFQNINRFSQ